MQVRLGQYERDSAIELLKSMISIKTVNPPGDEAVLACFITEFLAQHIPDVQMIKLNEKRANVLARIRGKGKAPTLLLNGHIDTVPSGGIPWKYDSFVPIVNEGKMYGRGSSDMKSGMAAMIFAVTKIALSDKKPDGDILILCTADEEADGLGAEDFIKSDLLKDVGAIVVGEPTSCCIGLAQKGVLWLEVVIEGCTAHGAYPWEGVNAIEIANIAISKIKSIDLPHKHHLLGIPSITVSTISGGIKVNMVPDYCKLTIDVRTLPGMKHCDIINQLREIMSNLEGTIPGCRISIITLNNRSPIETSSNHPFIRYADKTFLETYGYNPSKIGTGYFSDASIFLKKCDIPVLLFGPGEPQMAHKPDEYVYIERYITSIEFFYELCMSYSCNLSLELNKRSDSR